MTTLVKHKRVNYSELFYDLVFVFAISKDKNRAPKPERRRPEAIWNRCESADDSLEKVCVTKRKSCFADKF